MQKCNFNNSIEITLWYRFSPVNLLHLQVFRTKKYSRERGRANSLQKNCGHHGWSSKKPFQLILSQTSKNTYLHRWVM